MVVFLLLWNVPVGAACGRPLRAEPYELSEFGIIIDNEIRKISQIHPNVNIEKYVIMPNHIHMILMLDQPGRNVQSYGINIAEKRGNGRPKAAPTLRIPISMRYDRRNASSGGNVS